MTASLSDAESNAALSALIHSDNFLDQIRTGIILYDTYGVAFNCNQAATKLLGLAPDQSKGHRPFDMPFLAVGDDGLPLRANQYPSAIVLRTGEPCLGAIIGVDTPGQRRLWLSMDGYPLVIDGETRGAAVWFNDISDQYQEHQSHLLLNRVNHFVMSTTSDVDPLQSVCDVLVKDGFFPIGLDRHRIPRRARHDRNLLCGWGHRIPLQGNGLLNRVRSHWAGSFRQSPALRYDSNSGQPCH